MKKRTKAIIAAITLYVMLPMIMIPSSATPATRVHWFGTAGIGAMTSNEDSPVLLTDEKLTFNVVDYPDHLNKDGEKYNSTLRGEYTLFNPTDEEISLKTIIPVPIPHDYEADGAEPLAALDGQNLESVVRHTLTRPGYKTEQYLDILRAGYISDDYYNDKLIVTKYAINISSISEDDANNSHLICELLPSDCQNRTIFLNADQSVWHEDGMNVIDVFLRSETEFYLYVFGAPFETVPDFEVHKYYYNDAVLDCTVSVTEAEKLTFSDFIYENYEVDGVITEMDWHNLVMEELILSGYDGKIAKLTGYVNNYDGYTSRWYEQEVKIAPKSYAVYTEVTPIYPTVNEGVTPFSYEYTYYYSPLPRTSNTTTKVKINYDYFVIECFADGYELSPSKDFVIEKIPENYDSPRISFTLCESETPQENKTQFSAFLIILLVVLLPLIVIVYIITMLFRTIRGWFFI